MDVIAVTTADGTVYDAVQVNSGGYGGANDGNLQITTASGLVFHVPAAGATLEPLAVVAAAEPPAPPDAVLICDPAPEPAPAPDATDPMGGGHDTVPPDVTTTVEPGVGGTAPALDAEA